MSSSSSLKYIIEPSNTPNFKTKSLNLKNKNRYASSDIKLLITKYKEKQIIDSVNEKLSDINNPRIKNDSIENLQKEKSTQVKQFKTSPNFFNLKIPKIKNKFYFSYTNLNFYKIMEMKKKNLYIKKMN